MQIAEPWGSGPHPALVLLPGAGGNVGIWIERLGRRLAARGVAVYGVHYLDRTATTRATRALIDDGAHFPAWLATAREAVDFVAAQEAVDAGRLGLLGISLGAFLSLALATEERRMRAVIAISGGIPEPCVAAVDAGFPRTLLVHGMVDTAVPFGYAEQLVKLLTEHGVEFETVFLPGEGHHFTPAALRRLVGAVEEFVPRSL